MAIHSMWRCRWPTVLVAVVLCACSREPVDPADAAGEARELARQGELVAAAARVGEALGRWPEDPALRELQGDLDLRLGRANLALSAYRKALQLDPARRALRVKMARALLAEHRYPEVLAMPPPDPTADTAEVRAGLSLARLEAELALGSSDFRGRREEAEALWRLSATSSADPGLAEVAARLSALARAHEAIEAGRQHAQCHRRPAAAAGSADTPAAAANHSAVIRVGPTRRLKRPSEAAAIVTDGAVVEIDAGLYAGDTAIWTRNGLTLRGHGGRAHMVAPAEIAEQKGIWLIKGDRTTVQNIEFSGARSRYRNGSGIRLEGAHLTVRHSVFHDNQGGILTTNSTPASDIYIGYSEFRRNTSGSVAGEIGHNIYIGRARSFTLEFSYVHGAQFGHNVKSRARINHIRYNRIADGEDGRASYLIDLAEGGLATIIGNELQKGPFAENRPFVSYGAEAHRHRHPENRLVVVNNTFYSAFFEALGVKVAIEAAAIVVNNLFAGAPLAQVVGTAVREPNVVLLTGGLVDPKAGDFRLTRDSPAVDAGIVASASGEPLPVAEFEYRHPVGAWPRPRAWIADAGAHEYCNDAAGGSAGTS